MPAPRGSFDQGAHFWVDWRDPTQIDAERDAFGNRGLLGRIAVRYRRIGLCVGFARVGACHRVQKHPQIANIARHRARLAQRRKIID